MKKNTGVFDRIIRILFAIVIAILILTGSITTILSIILGIFAVMFLITGIIGYCGLYTAFGISTCAKKK